MSIKNFGLPYTGSKSRIAPWLMEMLPACDHFVDVFAGGCAVSHAMMLYNKARKITLNDLQGDVVNLFLDALHGNLEKYAPYQWIDRKTFFEQKDNNPFIRLVYSFGNNGKDYLYSKEIEEYKHAVHLALVEDNWILFSQLCPELYEQCKNELLKYQLDNENYYNSIRVRRLHLQKKCIEILCDISGHNWCSDVIQQNPFYRGARKEWITHGKNGSGIESIQILQHIGAAGRIELINDNINVLPVINVQSKDYRLLDIPNNSVVFCDPPYKNSSIKYNNIKFDHEEFYNWCIEKAKNNDVFVTEYNIEHPNFKLIGEKARKISMNGIGSKGFKTERLYKAIP